MTSEGSPALAQSQKDPLALVNASVGELMAMSGAHIGADAQPRTAPPNPELAEASDSGTAVPRLVELTQSRDVEVRVVLAQREACPISVLSALANDRRPEVRVAIAANAATVGAVAESLMGDKDRTVLEALAANPAVSTAVLERLAQHRKAPVRGPAIATLTTRAAAADRTPASLPHELHERHA